MRPQPLLCVSDVEASSQWYQQLLGCESAHGGHEYGRVSHEGKLILQLHSFKADHHHGPIGDVADKPYGNGVLVWFETDDFDAAMQRIKALAPEIVMERHVNSNAMHWECWVRDPDGYVVVIASPDGTAP
jgi:catechol 2,3-dioxygenase-like lactoylglutathione lyase family enzyme